MDLYFMRHGESTADLENKYISKLSTPKPNHLKSHLQKPSQSFIFSLSLC